jgi:hypothetical protein
MSELPSEYHRRLPYGDRMSAEPLIGLPFFPFEGDVQVVPLDQPVLPEPPRRGEVLTATLGPVIQRVAAAIRSIDGVARTHFNRWGDGSEHFHLWFLARPLGLMQLRGAMIAAWDDMLPKLPQEEFEANARTVAAALAESGGEPVGIARG